MRTKPFTILALTLPAPAQTTVKDVLVKHWKTSGDFTLAVARAMPADSYNFRPVPEEMSFGQLMAHIGGINLYACANASGLARPALRPRSPRGPRTRRRWRSTGIRPSSSLATGSISA